MPNDLTIEQVQVVRSCHKPNETEEEHRTRNEFNQFRITKTLEQNESKSIFLSIIFKNKLWRSELETALEQERVHLEYDSTALVLTPSGEWSTGEQLESIKYWLAKSKSLILNRTSDYWVDCGNITNDSATRNGQKSLLFEQLSKINRVFSEFRSRFSLRIYGSDKSQQIQKIKEVVKEDSGIEYMQIEDSFYLLGKFQSLYSFDRSLKMSEQIFQSPHSFFNYFSSSSQIQKWAILLGILLIIIFIFIAFICICAWSVFACIVSFLSFVYFLIVN